MSKRFAVLLIVMITLGSISTFSAPHVLADWLIDSSGSLIELDPTVLGDDDVDLSTTQASEIEREKHQQKEEAKRELAKQKLERKIELNKRTNKNIKNEFEISSAGRDLKVKQKTKLQNGQDRVIELEMKENEKLHVDQQDGESVEIEATKPGLLEITKDKIKSHTRLPISVNENNELTVTRPDGTTKIVSVLPDVAAAKMRERGILRESIPGGDQITENIELTTNESGEPVYSVKQEVNKKLLGFIAMKFKRETEVSATDSESVITNSSETNPWRKFLESLSR